MCSELQGRALGVGEGSALHLYQKEHDIKLQMNKTDWVRKDKAFFLLLFEQGPPAFHFSLTSMNFVAVLGNLELMLLNVTTWCTSSDEKGNSEVYDISGYQEPILENDNVAWKT